LGKVLLLILIDVTAGVLHVPSSSPFSSIFLLFSLSFSPPRSGFQIQL